MFFFANSLNFEGEDELSRQQTCRERKRTKCRVGDPGGISGYRVIEKKNTSVCYFKNGLISIMKLFVVFFYNRKQFYVKSFFTTNRCFFFIFTTKDIETFCLQKHRIPHKREEKRCYMISRGTTTTTPLFRC